MLTPIDKQQPSLGSWLAAGGTTGARWMGCLVCKAAALEGGWGTMTATCETAAQWSHIQRHATSASHKAAVQSFLLQHLPGLPQQPSMSITPVETLLAPAVENFQKVLLAKQRGQSCLAASAEVGQGRTRTAMMTWCLAEAAKDAEKSTLSSCIVIGLHQDGSAGRLLVRYTAVDGRLERHTGLLGLAQDFGTKSNDTYKATMSIIRAFCTSRTSPANPVAVLEKARGHLDDFDRTLHDNIKRRVELFDADAAADEQRVARLLRGKSTSGPQHEALPNLKVIMRDRTHAATRCAHSLASQIGSLLQVGTETC
jgi:hypothetical protein